MTHSFDRMAGKYLPELLLSILSLLLSRIGRKLVRVRAQRGFAICFLDCAEVVRQCNWFRAAEGSRKLPSSFVALGCRPRASYRWEVIVEMSEGC